jgi:hypothetical protein
MCDALNQIAKQAAGCARGKIGDAKVKAGFAIPQGKSCAAAVAKQGGNCQKNLQKVADTSAKRANQLKAFIGMTNDAENSAKKSAADFGKTVPASVPGGNRPLPGSQYTPPGGTRK